MSGHGLSLDERGASPVESIDNRMVSFSMSASPRSVGRRSPSQASPRSQGSPRTSFVRRLREERERAAASAVPPLGSHPALAGLLQHAAAEAFSGDRAQPFHGLRVLRSAWTARHKASAASATSLPPRTADAPAKTVSSSSSTDAAAWEAALDGFRAMRQKAGSAAATFPAITYTAIVGPVALAQVPGSGLSVLWEAARDICAPRRRALKVAAKRDALAAAREQRAAPVDVTFSIKAPLSLPSAPHASVPWLELLVASVAHPSTNAEAEAARTLNLVVQSAARPTPQKVSVAELRALYTVASKRQPGEPDPTAVRALNSDSGFASHSAQRAKAREARASLAGSTSDRRRSRSGSVGALSFSGGASLYDEDADGEDPAALPHRLIVPPSQLTGLKMLIDIEDPPLHPETFCAAPATLKAMAMKKAIRENAKPPPTPAEQAEIAAVRASKNASSTRLAALLRAKGHGNESPARKTAEHGGTAHGRKNSAAAGAPSSSEAHELARSLHEASARDMGRANSRPTIV